MKKIIFVAAAAALMSFSIDASAQLGIGAGFAKSDLKEKADIASIKQEKVSNANGLYVNADYTFRFNHGLGFTPGIEWVFVGDSDIKELSTIDAKGKAKFKEHYINVPLKLNWGVDLKVVRVFVFAGPTLSFNVSSKTKTSGSVLGIETGESKVDTKDFFDKLGGKYGSFDLMMGAGAGVDIANRVRVKFGYDWGLVNRGNSDIKLHRQQLQLGVAFLFK